MKYIVFIFLGIFLCPKISQGQEVQHSNNHQECYTYEHFRPGYKTYRIVNGKKLFKMRKVPVLCDRRAEQDIVYSYYDDRYMRSQEPRFSRSNTAENIFYTFASAALAAEFFGNNTFGRRGFNYNGISNGFWLFSGMHNGLPINFRIREDYSNPINASFAFGGGTPQGTQYFLQRNIPIFFRNLRRNRNYDPNLFYNVNTGTYVRR